MQEIEGFSKGMKVSLGNEYGVVLDKVGNNEMYGQIRWDTEKEEDTEDWRGLFGSFIQNGGRVINKDHVFQFITDEGVLKILRP